MGYDGCPGRGAHRVFSMRLAKEKPPKWKTGSGKDPMWRLNGGGT